MENTLKQKLAAGAQPIGTFFDTASVSLMECLGRTGLDFAIIDNEHSPIEAETTAALVRAAELSGICPLARVREISRPAVLKLLDVGVQGLIVPNVKTLAQVQELVNYAKYYPIGQRGFCPSRKDGWGFDGLGSVPETMRHFNGETLLFPQCETAEALAIIEDICAVDGVDGIFVGPFDLSISMGMPGQRKRRCWQHLSCRNFRRPSRASSPPATRPESTACSSPARPTAWSTASAGASTPWPTVSTPRCSFRA